MRDPRLAYFVVLVRDPVDDALARAVHAAVRGVDGAGWFDDPAAPSPAERTTGGYVRVSDPAGPEASRLLAVAAELSAEHRVVLEVQWREEVVGQVADGQWSAVER